LQPDQPNQVEAREEHQRPVDGRFHKTVVQGTRDGFDFDRHRLIGKKAQNAFAHGRHAQLSLFAVGQGPSQPVRTGFYLSMRC